MAREFEGKAKEEEEEEDESKRRGVSRSGGLEERGRARRETLRRRGGACDILVMYVDWEGAQGRSYPVLALREALPHHHLLFCRPPDPHQFPRLHPLHSRFH